MVEPFAAVPLNVTVTFESPAVDEIVEGAEAAPCVVKADDVAPAELPMALTATTLYVYAVPLVNPVHVYVVPVPVHVAPAGEDVTV